VYVYVCVCVYTHTHTRQAVVHEAFVRYLDRKLYNIVSTTEVT